MVQKSFRVFFFFLTCACWKEPVENTSHTIGFLYYLHVKASRFVCVLRCWRRWMWSRKWASASCTRSPCLPFFLSIKFEPHYVGWCQNTTSPGGQQAAEDHTRRTRCQTTLLVENVWKMLSELLPLHCSVNKGKVACLGLFYATSLCFSFSDTLFIRILFFLEG